MVESLKRVAYALVTELLKLIVSYSLLVIIYYSSPKPKPTPVQTRPKLNPNSTKIFSLDESVVATQHDKIVHLLVTSVGEIHMKTMPAAMFRLLTGQDQPLYL